MFNVEQFAKSPRPTEGARILFFKLVCQENSHQQKESMLNKVAIQKIVLSRLDSNVTFLTQ